MSVTARGGSLNPTSIRPLGIMPAVRRRVPAWAGFLTLGLVGLLGYFAAPRSVQGFGYVAFGAAGIVALIVGIRRYRPERSAAWIAVAIGIALEVAGDTSYAVLEQSGSVAIPSIADVFYLVGPVVLAIGFAGLATPRRRGQWDAVLLDATLVATSAAVLTWTLVIDGQLDQQPNVVAVVISCLYPLLDLVLVAVLARHLLSAGKATPSLIFLVTGFAIWLAADFSYIGTSVAATYVPGGLIDSGWLLGYLLVGAGALHPSMADVRRPARPDRTTRPRIAVIAASLLVAVVVLAAHPIEGPEDLPIGVLGAVVIVALVVIRLTASFRRSEELGRELERQAVTDALTGLRNRRAFVEEAKCALAGGEPVALIFIDLDGFKRINDTWGHDAGDLLLVQVATRLADAMQSGSVVARLGGDEFGILVHEVESVAAPNDVAAGVLEALNREFVVGDTSLRVGASIGIALGQRGDFATLARDADVAMYEAKRAGGGRIQVHRAAHRHVVSEHRLAYDLQRAVERNQLRVWYQPIFDLASGRLTAAEALVRWEHPSRGLIAPAAFIPLAESTGAIGAIDAWVLRTALAHVGGWQGDGLWPRGCDVHVNVSAVRLTERPFVEALEAALTTMSVEPRTVVIELTETADLAAPGISRLLTRVHDLGVKLAMDDFGTHYAALSSLATLPFDIVKLDRSLLPVDRDPAATRLIGGVVRLMDAIDVSVVAEGIETDDQLTLLRSLGCANGQGYLLARPVSADDFGRSLGQTALPLRVGIPMRVAVPA